MNPYIVAGLGWAIVFAALISLVGVFSLIPKLLSYRRSYKLRKQGKITTGDGVTSKDLDVSGDVNAAIAMALFIYLNEMHDDESNVITIKQIEKRYTPWSSKVYGMNNTKLLR